MIKASKNMNIKNTILLLAPILITVVISELVSKRKTFAHASESYFIIEGRLTKTGGTAYANADEVALMNNAIMHLLAELSITYQTC